MALTHPLRRARFRTKIFPPSKEIHASLRLALRSWTTRNSLPSLPKTHLDALWHRSIHSHDNALHNHITHKDIVRFKRLFPDAIFHNEDKRATSLRIYCPVLYFQCLTATFADPLVFRKLEESPSDIIEKIYRTPMSCPNERSSSELDDQSLASLPHLSDLC